MDTELTIQQVARYTGLSIHTLRYYERCGLLRPVNRASNGHRRYSDYDITWLKFLTQLRTTGMPIRKMQQFASLAHQDPEAVTKRRELLEAHQSEVLKRLSELGNHLVAIEHKIAYYKDLEQEGRSDRRCIHELEIGAVLNPERQLVREEGIR